MIFSKTERMCKNKDHYESQMQAAAAIGRVRFKYKRDCRSYKCPICDGWHLTTQPRAEIQFKNPITAYYAQKMLEANAS